MGRMPVRCTPNEMHANVHPHEMHAHEVHAREIHAHEMQACEMIVSGLRRHRRYRRFLPTRVWPERVGTLPASAPEWRPVTGVEQ